MVDLLVYTNHRMGDMYYNTGLRSRTLVYTPYPTRCVDLSTRAKRKRTLDPSLLSRPYPYTVPYHAHSKVYEYILGLCQKPSYRL